MARCSDPKGALFCKVNGKDQFIDVADLGECSVEASVDVNAAASVKSSCAAAPTSDSTYGGGLAVVALAAGLGAIVGRRRNNKKS